MTDLYQWLTTVPSTGQDVALDESECPCPKPDGQYELSIDAGSVLLTHKACGKQPRGDYLDLVEMAPIPVTVKAEPYRGCDGGAWHGEYRCDCGTTLLVTPNVQPSTTKTEESASS